MLHVHQASARHMSGSILEHMEHGRCLPVAWFQMRLRQWLRSGACDM